MGHALYIVETVEHMMMIFGILVENDDFWYTCGNCYSCCCSFLIFFEIFFFQAVRAGRGLKGQKIAKMKNNNYIRLAPHLWNSIVDGHDFWYTCVK